MPTYKKNKSTKSKVAIALLLVFIILSVSIASTIFVFAEKQNRSATSVFYGSILSVVLPNNIEQQKSYKHLEKCRETNENYSVPRIYQTMYGFSVEEFEGYEVCVFNQNSTNTVMYLHGGAFIYQPLIFHYDFCKRLSEKLNVNVVMPIYPKAPNYTYDTIVPYCYNFYLSLLESTPADNIVFMGDSAGASLVMSLSQYIYDNDTLQPKEIFAFSPCVDISLSNPQIDEYASVDPMLKAQDLKIKMGTYIGDSDYSNPYISPYYCDFAVLPTMTVFIGGHEILIADCKKLNQELTTKNIAFNYYEYPFMNHTFSIFPMPEGEECIEIVQTIWGV